MSYPQAWTELAQDARTSSVYEARAFRPSRPDCFQFTDPGGGEHFAVRSLTPYGEVDDLDPQIRALLLPKEAAGSDYTLFRVPRGSLTLRGASFGQGKERALELRDAYQRLGSVAHLLTRAVPSPPLSLADFGIERRTGELLLIPPLELGHGTQDPETQLRSIETSITKTFRSVLPQATYQELITAVDQGFQEEPHEH
jgi:hypothetical protein